VELGWAGKKKMRVGVRSPSRKKLGRNAMGKEGGCCESRRKRPNEAKTREPAYGLHALGKGRVRRGGKEVKRERKRHATGTESMDQISCGAVKSHKEKS